MVIDQAPREELVDTMMVVVASALAQLVPHMRVYICVCAGLFIIPVSRSKVYSRAGMHPHAGITGSSAVRLFAY